MNVGSLFSGIGGFDLGLERAGMRTIWQVEQNAFRRGVLARHFPDARRYEDVCEVGAHNLEAVDLIAGGFPCQDLSLAGKGAGIDGARSGLWSEMWRIICELEPRWVVVENVPALTSRGLDRVLRDLAESGYDAEWDCLPASAFGAPHRRDRIWIVAYPRDDDGGPGGDVADTEGEPVGTGLRKGEPGGQRRRRPGDSGGSGNLQDAAGIGGGALGPQRRSCDGEVSDRPNGAGEQPGADNWTTEPNVGRVADGVPARVDRLSALGDALVPQIAQWIGERVMACE